MERLSFIKISMKYESYEGVNSNVIGTNGTSQLLTENAIRRAALIYIYIYCVFMRS